MVWVAEQLDAQPQPSELDTIAADLRARGVRVTVTRDRILLTVPHSAIVAAPSYMGFDAAVNHAVRRLCGLHGHRTFTRVEDYAGFTTQFDIPRTPCW